MKKKEIIREYKWVKVLHAILRTLDKLPGSLMSLIIILLLSPFYVLLLGLFFVLLTFPLWIPVLICNPIAFIIGLFAFYPWFSFLGMVANKAKKIGKIFGRVFYWLDLLWERSGSLRHYSPNLSGRLLQHYEKKWGMNCKQIDAYRHFRKMFDDKSILYMLPLLHRLAKLNVSDRDEQEIFLSERFNEDEIQQIFEMDDSDSQFEETINYWREKDLSEKKTLVVLLFKFTIVEDGIHNDEWKLLMQIITQLRFNNRYIEYFKDRFSSLRTEFDDYERKSTSSLGGYSFASLEPYYAILGLEEGASIEEIKRAYHELAMQHHPDLPKNANRKEECEAKMMEINEAYEKVRG